MAVFQWRICTIPCVFSLLTELLKVCCVSAALLEKSGIRFNLARNENVLRRQLVGIGTQKECIEWKVLDVEFWLTDETF